MTIFRKDDKILFGGKKYRAICVDVDTAVFAPIRRIKKDNCIRTSFTGLIALSNLEEFRENINFEFLEDHEI